VKSEREFYVVNTFLTNKVSCNDEIFDIGDDGKDINTSRQFWVGRRHAMTVPSS
jgi:hypothetical protein